MNASCRCIQLLDGQWGIIAWTVGWLNVLGQFATTSFAAQILAGHMASVVLLATGGEHVFSNEELLLTYAGHIDL